MITAKAFAGKHYAVLGLARSGAATARALVASGARVTAWDDDHEAATALYRRIKQDSVRGRTAEASFELQNWLLAKDLSGFEAIIVSPGVPINRHPVREKAERYGLPLIGDIELFARARPELPPHKVVGVTGTNGKSTTTALIHHILKTAGVPTTMGGNIGLPILAQDPLPEGGVYVLELSSYQIDLTQSLDCDVVIVLNITPDHLDRYQDFEDYAAAKARLVAMQSRGSVFMDEDLIDRSGFIDVIERMSVPPTVHFDDHVWSARQAELADQGNWPALQGLHNQQNALAALTACTELGLSLADIMEGLRTYPGLPHRMERVREKDGVLFVNDSKATNPTATAPALAAFPSIRWILGGRAKTDNLDECAPHFGHVRSAYTIGEAGELFARLLAPHMPVTNCETLENALKRAAADSHAGDTVLLSPACASFDQFKDFEQRGDRFKDLVGAL